MTTSTIGMKLYLTTTQSTRDTLFDGQSLWKLDHMIYSLWLQVGLIFLLISQSVIQSPAINQSMNQSIIHLLSPYSLPISFLTSLPPYLPTSLPPSLPLYLPNPKIRRRHRMIGNDWKSSKILSSPFYHHR